MTSILQWILLFLCPCIWVNAVNITKDPVRKTESTLVILTERNWIEGMGCTGIRGLQNKRENTCRTQPPPLGLWKHRKGLKLSEARVLRATCSAMLSHFSHVWLFVTPWVVAHQAPFSMGFSRQENWERGRIWSVEVVPTLRSGCHCFGLLRVPLRECDEADVSMEKSWKVQPVTAAQEEGLQLQRHWQGHKTSRKEGAPSSSSSLPESL